MERRAGSGPLGFSERSSDERKTDLPLVQLYAGNELRKNDREQQPPEGPARGLYVQAPRRRQDVRQGMPAQPSDGCLHRLYPAGRGNNTTAGGIGFCGLLAVAFIVLKLTGVINWSWLWVLAPIWVPTAITLAIIVIVLVVVLVRELTKGGRP